MKKKILSFALVIDIMSSLFFALPMTANAETSEIYTYIIENREVTITDCDESVSGEIRIPTSIDGYPVTNIGNGAFESCANLTQVYIPTSIKSIGERAFFGCVGITHLILNVGIKSIGAGAFLSCDSIKTVYYNAPEEMWDVVNIGENNDCLTNGTINFKLAVFRGDASSDGRIDVRDIIALRQFLAGGYNTVVANKASDTNKDDVVDVNDIVVLRQYIAGGYDIELMELYEGGNFEVVVPDSWKNPNEGEKVNSVVQMFPGEVEKIIFPADDIFDEYIIDFDTSNPVTTKPETTKPGKIFPDEFDYVIWQ